MQFAKHLRERVRRGEITCSVRIWKQPRVRVGGRYALAPGEIVVDHLIEIGPADITSELAKRSGFPRVDDLLAVAKHGRGDRVFVVEFHYMD